MKLTSAYKDKIRLVSNRLTLQVARPNVAGERYLSWLQDPQINRFLETRWQKQSISSIHHFVNERLNDPNSILFTIWLNGENQHIGNVKLGPINWHHGFAELSYFIGEREYWGQGIATEVIQAVSNWGLEDLALYMIKAGIYSTNIASQKALEKAGFEFEASFKDEILDDGVRVDHNWYTKKQT